MLPKAKNGVVSFHNYMLNFYFNLIIRFNNWINLVIELIPIRLCCEIFEPMFKSKYSCSQWAIAAFQYIVYSVRCSMIVGCSEC